MNKSIKSILTTSLIAAALMGTTIYSAAAETGTPGSQMMQGQRGDRQGYGPGMMGEGYGPGYGMNRAGRQKYKFASPSIEQHTRRTL